MTDEPTPDSSAPECPYALHSIPIEDQGIHEAGCPCREVGPHFVHRCEHGAEWWYK